MTAEVGRPLYQKLADEIRSQIASGALAVGDPIPSTAELMKRHSASNTVVRAAVAELRNEGLLLGQAGKAVYVRAKPETVEEERVSLRTLGAEMAELKSAVRDLADRVESVQPADLSAKVTEMQATIGLLQTHLIELYARLGQPYPHDSLNATTALKKQRRHNSGT